MRTLDALPLQLSGLRGSRKSISLACVVGIVSMLFAYVFPSLVPVLPPK